MTAKKQKSAWAIPERHFEGYAIIVDLNQFTVMVSKAQKDGDLIAQFTRDALSGAIGAIESAGGEVIAFMGDAVLGVFPSDGDPVQACFMIAKDLDDQCEYISNTQDDSAPCWLFAPGGPSLKIAVEFGTMDVSTIYSRFLGEHRLLIGSPINYAARIGSAGKGNRCNVGPAAAERAFAQYGLEGPLSIKGKKGEPFYTYYNFSMGDIWIEGPRKRGKETYWG